MVDMNAPAQVEGYILDGVGQGPIANQLIKSKMDPRVLRPYIGDDGRDYVDHVVRNVSNEPVYNADGTMKVEPRLVGNNTATLRKMDWIQLDQAILKVAKPRLKLVGQLRADGLEYSIPNGMGKMSFEYETQSDISGAHISMDGINRGAMDAPTFDLRSLPLPIISKEFQFTARQVSASQNNGHQPIDTSTAEQASRRVAEMVEQLAIGTAASYQYGGGYVYGMANFPQRMTRDITAPTAGGWVPQTTLADVIAMRQQAKSAFHFGPYYLFMSTKWDQYLDDDYYRVATSGALAPTQTLRERLAKLDGIKGLITLDYLQHTLGLSETSYPGTEYTMFLVSADSTVIRMVMGMDMTTVQWQTQGGMLLNFKVMTIAVPQLRYDANNRTGIVHGAPTS